MPVPSGLLIDIAVLIVREIWRSRRRRTMPATARTPIQSRPPARQLSPIGRLLRLVAIVAILWLVWREVTRRREALIAARRAVSVSAAPPLAPPAAPGMPGSLEEATPPAASPAPVPAVMLPAAPGAPESLEEATSPGSEREGGVTDSPAPAAASDDSEAEAQETRNGELIGWCARCREHHPMQRVTYTTNVSGRRIARGVCPVCGAGITRFVAWSRGKVEG